MSAEQTAQRDRYHMSVVFHYVDTNDDHMKSLQVMTVAGKDDGNLGDEGNTKQVRGTSNVLGISVCVVNGSAKCKAWLVKYVFFGMMLHGHSIGSSERWFWARIFGIS